MTEREAIQHGIEEHEDMLAYLESNVAQWKREHIIPMVVADWVGGIENWEQTVDHFLEKYDLLVNARRTLKEMRSRLRKLDEAEEVSA